MTLCDLKPGQKGKVLSFGTEGVLRHRLLDMGITSGIEIQLVKVAPLGDPLEIRLRGYNLSLRKSEASVIEIEFIG